MKKGITEDLFKNIFRTFSYEFRFPSNLEIESEIHKFQHKISDDFPRVEQVPDVIQTPEGLFQTNNPVWKFINNKNSITLNVKNTALALIFLKYDRFKNLHKLIKKYSDMFKKEYKIKKLNRIGYRYVMDYELEKNKKDKLSSLFVPAFNPKFGSIKDFTKISFEGRKDKPDKPSFTIRNGMILDKQDKYHYVFDLDSYVETKKSIKSTEIPSIEKTLRNNVLIEFDKLVTAKFIKLLKEK